MEISQTILVGLLQVALAHGLGVGLFKRIHLVARAQI
jgi:hypothetical protein